MFDIEKFFWSDTVAPPLSLGIVFLLAGLALYWKAGKSQENDRRTTALKWVAFTLFGLGVWLLVILLLDLWAIA